MTLTTLFDMGLIPFSIPWYGASCTNNSFNPFSTGSPTDGGTLSAGFCICVDTMSSSKSVGFQISRGASRRPEIPACASRSTRPLLSLSPPPILVSTKGCRVASWPRPLRRVKVRAMVAPAATSPIRLPWTLPTTSEISIDWVIVGGGEQQNRAGLDKFLITLIKAKANVAVSHLITTCEETAGSLAKKESMFKVQDEKEGIGRYAGFQNQYFV